ncbi:MAG TPA: EAL domain-containing protein [Tardiphaga sp.]
MKNWWKRKGGYPGASGGGAEQAAVRRNPVHWLIVSGAFAIAAIAVGTAVTVGGFRDRALESSKRELENTLVLLTRHFDQQFEDLQRIQRGLLADLRSNGVASPQHYTRQMTSYDAHLMLRAKVSNSISGELNLLNADGQLINWTPSWPAPEADLSDRSYFRKLKASATDSDEEIVEPIFSRLTGRWKTLFARKLTGPHGEFLGVVTRNVEAPQFEQFFASVTLGENSAISMFHRDGTLLARYPHAEALIGQNFSSGPLIQHVNRSDSPATMRIRSPLDNLERLGSVRPLRDFPIALVATATIDGVLTDWRAQTRFLISTAALCVLIIAGLLVLIIRQVTRQHGAAQAQLTLEKQRLDTAINNMTQGLLLFDAQARVVICNQSYMTMYRLSPDVIKPGCPFREVIAHRKATGSFQGDIDSYVDKVLSKVHTQTLAIMQTADGRAIQILGHPIASGGWVATHEDITERRRTEERIAHLAHYDALTDLPNRALFRDQLAHELTRVARGQNCAVIYIDIDEFKGINDSLGHPVGDELLKAVAQRLKDCVRSCDVVARLGGDEFAIVQTDVKEQDDIVALVANIYQAIREPFECLGHRLLTDASIGIALAPRDGTDLDQLLKNADLAMYAAKADGRRTYRFFEPAMDARVQARRTLEHDLRDAIADGGFAKGGFEIYYQPLLRLGDDAITGCEALLRWRHPVRGMISPAEFIPVAEDIGVINQLGEWVLAAACMEAASWPDDIRLAVNVSPVQFRSHLLALKVAAALVTSGLAPERLELEITEAVLIRDDEIALEILHRLRALGVRIALDDFGTGYSSLSYLQRFPFDKIKIDRCFVTDIAEINGSSAIVQAVVNIASSRHMTTTAEGVETEAQKQLLRTLGCTEMQGYLFSAAKPAAEVRALIAGHQKMIAAA